MHAGTAFTDSHSERRAFAARVALAALLVIGLLGLLVARLIQLQGLQHEYFVTRSNENRLQLEVVPGVRGLIFDRHGVLLAENLPAYRLELTPELVPDLEATLQRLGELVDIAPHELQRFRERVTQAPEFHSVPLKLKLSAGEVARFEVNRQRFPGVEVRAGLTRAYPQGATAAHLVGYVGGITAADLERVDAKAYRGASYIGKTGIERQYEHLLHGTPGSKLVEANAGGRRLRELEYTRPTPGRDLYLTIDSELQAASEAAFGERHGAAVTLDVNSGEILAMVSLPSFSPGDFVNGISHRAYRALTEDPYRPLFHRAVQGQYPPGSTLKPVMALAGLNHGLVTPHENIFCPGHYQLPDQERKYRDWKRRGHGRVNLHESIAQSCDVYFYDLAHRLEIDRIHDFLAHFGLGQSTGIDLPSGSDGLLPSRDWKRRARSEVWFPGETLNIGIGQGFMLTTPLQLAVMTARLATRGGGARPRLLHSVNSPGDAARQPAPTEPLPPIELPHPGSWRHVHDAMVAVVHGPTGTAPRIGEGLDYRMAGKTGTAQVAGLSQEDDEAPQLEDVPEHLRDHSLFIAYAPAEAPRIAVAAIAEHSGGGSAVAAPIVRRILDLALARTAGESGP